MTDQAGAGAVSIGAVLAEFAEEFPDLTVSKVRFLEAEGLLHPQRSPGGYRRFTAEDRAQLRYVLRAQRDHFLPLRVIKEHLEALSRGLEPPQIVDPSPRAPLQTPGVPRGPVDDESSATQESTRGTEGIRLTADELRRDAHLTRRQFDEASAQGLLAPDSAGLFGAPALAAARAVAALGRLGLTPRHLRAARLAADRIEGLVDQVAKAADTDAGRRAQTARDAAEQLELLHSALLHHYVHEQFAGE